MHFLLLDRGDFDFTTPDRLPIGGAESAFIDLARALARRGHTVEVFNESPTERTEGTLRWSPSGSRVPADPDMVVANRDPSLLQVASRKKARKVLWLHNTARHLLRPQHLKVILRERPLMVFSGPYHASTYPRWAPAGGRATIPYGTPEMFRTAPLASTIPPPRAIFTSNPLRSLDWLLDLWTERIYPIVPQAELHVFSGPQVYGAWGERVRSRMEPVIERARRAADRGVVVRTPVPRHQLVGEVSRSRVLLYRGDPAETYCLAVAEAQAVGVPAVVQPLGSVVERVAHGVTGFVCPTEDDFVDRAAALLRDDELWLRQHREAAERQRRWGWDEAAAAWEGLVGDDRRGHPRP